MPCVRCRDHFRDLGRVRALPVQLENGRNEPRKGAIFALEVRTLRWSLAAAAGFHFAILCCLFSR